jgi:hypothetical protein
MEHPGSSQTTAGGRCCPFRQLYPAIESWSAPRRKTAKLFGEGRYPTVFGRVGELREHPGDHRKLRVGISGIVALFAVWAVSKLMERLEEAVDDLLFHLGQEDFAAKLLGEARDTELFYAAGRDAIEPGEVGLHV